MDGFDHYGTSGIIYTLGKWASGAADAIAATSPVRTGSHSLRLYGNNPGHAISKPLSPASTGFVVGLAFNPTIAFTGTNDLILIREGTTVHLTLSVSAAGVFLVRRGTTTLATGTTAIVLNSWTYLEFKGIIHDTTGSYEVKIDTVTEAALTNAGPTDTRNGGTTGQWDRVCLINPYLANTVAYVEDFYICDTSGSAPRNDFLGAVKIETLYPQTDAVAAGSNAGLTCSTGTDHGALVDETTPNTSDYNSGSTVGVKDTYNYPAMALAGTVLGVQANLYMQKTDATARTVCTVTRSASTDSDGANVSPLTSWAYFSEVRAQDPNAGSPIEWTVAAVNAAQFGMKVTS